MSYESSFYKTRNVGLKTIQSTPIFFASLQPSPLYLKMLADIVKHMDLQNKRHSWRLHSFSVTFEM